MVQLKSSVAASDALSAKSTEDKTSLKTVCEELASLKEQVTRLDGEKGVSENVIAEVRKESKQLMVWLNVAPDGRNRAEKLTLLLVSMLSYTVYAVVQQYGYDAVSGLRQGL